MKNVFYLNVNLFNAIYMDKPRHLVKTPTPVEGTPTAVDIVTRVAQYTKIVFACWKYM